MPPPPAQRFPNGGCPRGLGQLCRSGPHRSTLAHFASPSLPTTGKLKASLTLDSPGLVRPSPTPPSTP